MLSRMSDDELMQQLKAGNKQAFRELYGRHSGLVLGYVMRFTPGNRALAEDIQQEVWMRVLRAVPRYEGKGQYRAWLLTIARNTSFTQLGRPLKLHDEPAEEESQIPADTDLEAELGDKVDGARVKAAIDALPDSQRVVLTLWLVEEASYEEICESTGMSEPSVRSLLFRAKKALRAKLEAA